MPALSTQQQNWLEANVKAKSAITLTLADGPLAQVSKLIDDDDKATKELWKELDKVYGMSNTQMVVNIEREIEIMKFDKDEEWDKHVEHFHHLIEKLASYDKPLSAENKVSKLLRKFPTRFAPITMVAKALSVPFEKVIVSAKAEISRCKTSGATSKHVPSVAASAAKGGRNPTNSDGRIRKNKKDLCYV